MKPSATITPLAPWIAETEHRRRSSKLKKFSIGVLALTILGGGTWLAAFSQVLALDPNQVEINAEASSLVDIGAVAALISEHYGKPLVRINTAALVSQTEEIPGVKQVQIARDWPTGLRVDIGSRVPAAAVVTDAGFSWVDYTGTVMGNFATTGDLVKLGSSYDEPRVYADMVTIWEALTPDLQQQVRVLRASTTDDISAVLHSGQRIAFGSAEQIKLKIATALALLDKAPNSYLIDVSSPALPITR